MVTIDVPSCMALGAAVALVHPKEPVWTSRFRTLGVCLFGFTPLAHLFELYFHDWEWQYPAPTLPPWTSMAFIIVMNALGVATFELARTLDRRKQWLLFFAINGAVGLYCLVFFRRVFWVGTFAEWTAGTAPFMLTRLDFLGLLAGTGLWLGVSIYVWIFAKRSRHERPSSI